MFKPRLQILVLAIAAASAGAIAAPTSYTIDPTHTYPSFEADHMGISYWRGKVNKNSGVVVLDKEAGTGTVEISIDLASIDFGLEAMNAWAIGEKFFNVTKSPTALYKGRLEQFVNGSPTLVNGELTLNGHTKPVQLVVTRFKCIPHPMVKRELCVADASGSFRRDAFGPDAALSNLYWDQVGLILAVIFVVVILTEITTSTIRKRII